MSEVQRGVGFVVPQMMWNPPWLVLLFAPLAVLSLSLATWLWISVSTGAFLSLVLVGLKEDRRLLNGALLTGGFAFPAWVCLELGQLGLVLGLSAAMFIRSYSRSADWGGGGWLVLLFVKPHLFIPFFFILLLISIRSGRWRPIIAAFGALLFLSLLIETVVPGVHRSWIEGLLSVDPSRSSVQSWKPATLSGYVGELLLPSSVYPRSFALLFTAVSTLFAAIYYLRRRATELSEREWSLLLAFSVLVSPYGWVMDAPLFLPAVAVVFSVESSRIRNFAVFALILVGLLPFFLRGSTLFFHHEFVFVPITLAALSFVAFRYSASRSSEVPPPEGQSSRSGSIG